MDTPGTSRTSETTMSGRWSSLPAEILFDILGYYTCMPAEIARLMLVCHNWAAICRYLLYRDIALTADSLMKWTSNASSEDNDALTRTLTLGNYAQATVSTHHLTQADHVAAVVRFDNLQRSVNQLRSKRFATLMRLSSLSIYGFYDKCFSSCDRFKFDFSGLLTNLPSSVRHLEIRRVSFGHFAPAGTPHLCPLIRSLLPQLRTLHIQLSETCPDLCGFGFSKGDDVHRCNDRFQPVEAEHLEELIIEFARPPPSLRGERPVIKPTSLTTANISMITYLRAFVTKQQLPNLRRLWTVNGLSKRKRHRIELGTYRVFVRRDVLANKSYGLSFYNVGGDRKNGYWIRMPEHEGGADYVCTRVAAWELLQGTAWRETSNGCRIPLSFSSGSTERTSVSADVLTPSAYKAKTGMSCALWEEEWRSGVRLSTNVVGELMDEM